MLLGCCTKADRAVFGGRPGAPLWLRRMASGPPVDPVLITLDYNYNGVLENSFITVEVLCKA